MGGSGGARQLGAVASLAAALAAPAGAREPRITATLESEAAVGLRDGRAQKLEAVLEPEVEWRVGADLELTAVGRLRGDAFDRLEPGSPAQETTASPTRRVFWGDRVDAELRELYADARLGRASLRVGKQQIVWGEADGLKVLDVVNPQSFREFILDEFEDSRIPLWSARLEVPVGPADLTLVWIPDPTVHELPEPDALFAFTSERLLPPRLPGHAVALEDLDRPSAAVSDSDAGARLHGFVGGFDLALAYLWQVDDRPVFRARRGTSPFGPALFFTPTYERTHRVGGTFANAVGDFTFRGEAVWSSDLFLPTEDPSDADLAAETSELGLVLGLDWYGLRDGLVSLQVFQSWLLREVSGLLRDRLDTTLTLFVQRRLWNDRMALEGMWLHNLNDADGLVRPRVSYQLGGDVTVWLGFDVFYGRARGLFGQFDARDRAVVGMRWGF